MTAETTEMSWWLVRVVDRVTVWRLLQVINVRGRIGDGRGRRHVVAFDIPEGILRVDGATIGRVRVGM